MSEVDQYYYYRTQLLTKVKPHSSVPTKTGRLKASILTTRRGSSSSLRASLAELVSLKSACT